jgi:predicted MFS family arabinose efflux permease
MIEPAPSYYLLIAARVLAAFAHGTFLGVGSLIAARLARPDKRVSAVSMVLAGVTVSNIIGVPFGTFIGQLLGWRASECVLLKIWRLDIGQITANPVICFNFCDIISLYIPDLHG